MSDSVTWNSHAARPDRHRRNYAAAWNRRAIARGLPWSPAPPRASALVVAPMVGVPVYSAFKAAVRAFTVALRGLDSGQDEIAAGLAKAASSGSSMAPGRLLQFVNKPA